MQCLVNGQVIRYSMPLYFLSVNYEEYTCKRVRLLMQKKYFIKGQQFTYFEFYHYWMCFSLILKIYN